jgi:hypothetical protein
MGAAMLNLGEPAMIWGGDSVDTSRPPNEVPFILMDGYPVNRLPMNLISVGIESEDLITDPQFIVCLPPISGQRFSFSVDTRPEPVLQLEPDHAISVVGMPLGEACGGIERKYPHTTGVEIAGRVGPALFVRDLDKHVAADAPVLPDFPNDLLFVVVDFPDPGQGRGDDGFVFRWDLPRNPLAEDEVGHIVREPPGEVDGDLMLAGNGKLMIPPVVSQVEGFIQAHPWA